MRGGDCDESGVRQEQSKQVLGEDRWGLVGKAGSRWRAVGARGRLRESMSATAPTGKEDKEDSAAGRKAANNQDVKKRWGVFILVCLLLGMVTTVAVAWGIAVRVDLSRSFISSYSEIVDAAGSPIGLWLYEERRSGSRLLSVGWRQVSWRANDEGIIRQLAPSTIAANSIPDISLLRLTAADPRWLEHSSGGLDVEARGWPLPALWRDVSDSKMLREWPGLQRPVIRGAEGIALPWIRGTTNPSGSSIRLPIRPIPSGLVIDTVCFGLVWFGAFGFVPCCRELRRRRPGRCTSCGYDLTGNQSGTCPECGATTVARAASP